MISILIVDDEKLERNGIKFLLKKEEKEYQIIEAVNGKDALGILQKQKVDILFSDIKMPYMNGLELSQQAMELYPDLQIIIFSGYNDFSYAREALRYGVMDYVLKPVDPVEFKKTLDKVIHNIENQKEMLKKQIKQEDYLKQYFLLNYLLTGKEEYIESANKVINLEKEDMNQYPYLMLAGSSSNFFEIDEENFLQDLRENLQRSFQYLNLNSNESLFFFKDRSCDYQRLALQMHNFFRQRYDADCYFVISEELESYRDMPKYLIQMEQLLEEQFYQPEIHVFSMNQDQEESEGSQVKDAKMLQNIIEDIHHKDVDHLWLNFQRIEKKYKDNNQFSELYVKFVFSSVLKEIYEGIAVTGERELSREVDRMYRCKTIQEVLEIAKKAIREFENYLKVQDGGDREEVTLVKSYIYHHYDKVLTTELLAEQVCLSPGYLSFVFKQETGVNLNRFIREYRMEKAKELLETTNMKIVQIAKKVGFPNNSYFGRSFREYFGNTPESYRKGTATDEEDHP